MIEYIDFDLIILLSNISIINPDQNNKILNPSLIIISDLPHNTTQIY